MLSVTNSISDIKTKLENTYDYYGFSSDAEFTSAITSVLEDIYLEYFLSRVGSTEYTRIATKNKVGLTDYETYVYWAEVYITCSNFLKRKEAIQNQLQNQAQESLKVEGYQYSVGSGSGGTARGDKSVKYYFEQAYVMFKRAGFNIMSLERTSTIFGDGLSIDITNVD